MLSQWGPPTNWPHNPRSRFALTIDGVWSAIGSSNFDHRSVLFNDEVDAIVLGAEVARGLQQRFSEDQRVAREITLAAWRARPLIDRMSDVFHRPWQSFF